MFRPATVLAIIALLGVFVLFVRQSALKDQIGNAHAAGNAPVVLNANAPVQQAPIEVAPHMARIQAHAEKLWWAGQAGNLELAKFYRHEIKEEMEVIADAGLVDAGIPVSEQMKVYGIRAIDALKEQLATDGLKDFKDRYENVVNTCNSCHRSTGHPMIRIRVPQENRFTGQDFTAQH